MIASSQNDRYLELKISMCKIILMHLIKIFKYLICQLSNFYSWNNPLTKKIMMKIAMTTVLHDNKNWTLIVKSVERFYKPCLVLDKCQTWTSSLKIFKLTRSCENLTIAFSSRLKSKDSKECNDLLMIFTARKEFCFDSCATHFSSRTCSNPSRSTNPSPFQCSSREKRRPALSISLYEWVIIESWNRVRSFESSTRSDNRDIDYI
jgi:hypothetical protein